MDFGSRLREIRERVGLTQSELAEGIAASSYISLLETGKRKPKPEMIEKFSSRLGISADELLLDQSSQEIALNVNMAKVALSSGDLESARDYANQVLAFPGIPATAHLAATVVLLQVRAREGLFEGLLDDFERLFKENTFVAPDLRARLGNEIMSVCFRSGNLALGVQRGEEMLRDYSIDWPETEVVEMLCLLASCHYHRGDTPRAAEIVSRALKLAEKCKSPKAMVQSYWQSSMLAESRGDLPLALNHITTAMHWTKLAELNQVLPILNDNAARWMLELPNPDFARIHSLAESAYLDLASQNNPGHAAYTCATLSEVEVRLGNYEDALMYARKGLLELPLGIPGPRASLYCQEAKVLFRMGRIDDAKKILEVAVNHMSEMTPSKELALYWGEIARVFVEVGLQDRAIGAYEQAIAVAAMSQAEQEEFADIKV
ncbi:MAG: helix-turn-helix domain-containing protein [Candidatus Nanopelagicaceae bacterium]